MRMRDVFQPGYENTAFGRHHHMLFVEGYDLPDERHFTARYIDPYVQAVCHFQEGLHYRHALTGAVKFKKLVLLFPRKAAMEANQAI
jgi:hypothetical protein